MRLDLKQIQLIKNSIDEVMPGWNEGELYLFGSRVDDTKKGGDIDLVLIFKDDSFFLSDSLMSLKIVARIKKDLGERRIDFSIISKTKSQNSFWHMALNEAVRLD